MPTTSSVLASPSCVERLRHTPAAATPAPEHHVQISRRLNAVSIGGTTGLGLLIVICLWGDWRAVAIVIALQAAVIGFTTCVDHVRFRVIRDMLVASDQQRIAIERANAELVRAHQQLAAETRQRLDAETELRQAQKLEAVGRLASGVAHEINTPVQFVSDSVHFLRDAVHDLMAVVSTLQEVRQAVLDGAPAAALATAAAAVEEAADLEYLFANVPRALDRSLDGLGRVATIVRSMKEFAHPETKERTGVDLNRAVESTLTIARHEYKYVADVETDYGELPTVLCHAGDLNQAVLNIVVNAAHAIGDVVQDTDHRGRIAVRTWCDGGDALISISDTGGGIPEEIRDRIFDPFFTTKAVGKGTGQGLAIARSVIVDRHGGDLRVDSTVGRGTTFVIRIPVAPAATTVRFGALA